MLCRCSRSVAAGGARRSIAGAAAAPPSEVRARVAPKLRQQRRALLTAVSAQNNQQQPSTSSTSSSDSDVAFVAKGVAVSFVGEPCGRWCWHVPLVVFCLTSAQDLDRRSFHINTPTPPPTHTHTHTHTHTPQHPTLQALQSSSTARSSSHSPTSQMQRWRLRWCLAPRYSMQPSCLSAATAAAAAAVVVRCGTGTQVAGGESLWLLLVSWLSVVYRCSCCRLE